MMVRFSFLANVEPQYIYTYTNVVHPRQEVRNHWSQGCHKANFPSSVILSVPEAQGQRKRLLPACRPQYLFSSSSSSFLFIMATIACRSSPEGRKRSQQPSADVTYYTVPSLIWMMWYHGPTCQSKSPLPFTTNSDTV